jgi:hypothetical protein
MSRSRAFRQELQRDEDVPHPTFVVEPPSDVVREVGFVAARNALHCCPVAP